MGSMAALKLARYMLVFHLDFRLLDDGMLSVYFWQMNKNDNLFSKQ